MNLVRVLLVMCSPLIVVEGGTTLMFGLTSHVVLDGSITNKPKRPPYWIISMRSELFKYIMHVCALSASGKYIFPFFCIKKRHD